MSLKIGFFGAAPFVTKFLEAICASRHKLVFIVTSPDKPKGRGKTLLPPEAKLFSEKTGIPCLQPADIKTQAFLDEIKRFDADMFMVIAYGKKLQKEILYMPPLGSFNLHFSLLPRWRGAAPVNHAVINGDKKTGLTFMKMDEGLDTGDIAFQETVVIEENDTAIDLFAKLVSKGESFLIGCLDKIEAGDVKYRKQDNNNFTYAGMMKKEDGLLDWKDGATRLHNIIRGLQPWPGAYTFFEGKRLIIRRAELIDGTGVPGHIERVDDKGVVVGTGNGCVRLLEIQEEGKSRINAPDFARGRSSITGKCFNG